MNSAEGLTRKASLPSVTQQAMTGQGAASRKYDLLSIIGAFGLSGDPMAQRSALRLMTLVTARYDWRRDRLAVGQREIAALWSVDERTVKREMARLRDSGWLILRRQGARGRVSEYALGIETVLAETRGSWDAIGPDLVARLSGASVPAGTDPNVIAFPAPRPLEDIDSVPVLQTLVAAKDQGIWGRISAALGQENPARHSAWIAPLTAVAAEPDQLILRAPSRFHATYVETHLAATLWRAARGLLPDLKNLRILPPE